MGLVQIEDGKVFYYPYVPSRAAGFAFVALFAITTAVHIVLMGRMKTWFFIPMVLGGICETFGYYGRAWGHDLPDSPRPFMLQLMLILVAPVFVSATLYVTLGKFKQAMLGRPARRCSPTSVFVLADVIAFCTQIGGGLVQVTGDTKIMAIGDHVVLGGLIFQLVVLAIYGSLVLRLYRHVSLDGVYSGPWKRYVCMLAASVMAIWVRNLVRAIEFTQGFHGFLSSHEAMLYVFDAFPMFLIMFLFAILHPGHVIRRSGAAWGRKIPDANNGEERTELEWLDRR